MLKRFAKKHQALTLLLIVLLAFLLRLRGLEQVGFNDDEIAKADAARSYFHGDFLVNLEHPMLLKSLVTASLKAASVWNRSLGLSHPIPDEVAVRLPNVIFGSLTAVVLFLFAQEFFGFEVGIVSAFLWAVGTISISVNRHTKEDTLLVFFTWLAYYFYLRAKKLGPVHTRQQVGLYAASGASFGLMLASKYFPHYLGLNFFYYYLVGSKGWFPARRRVDGMLLFGTFALVFFLANPIILHPATLKHIFHYVQQESITHHGYLMMGRFYTEALTFQGGMPIYFYPLFLFIKTPLPILVGFAIGLVEVVRRRREAGSYFLLLVFLFWIVPFSLVSGKWLRYMLSWMPSVYMMAAIGIVKSYSWLTRLAEERVNRKWVPALVTSFALLFVAEPFRVAVQAGPFYSLYLNPLGMGRAGYFFPHDEFSDAGLREAIQRICAEAPKGATVGGEAPTIFTYYLHEFGRDDLRYFELCDPLKRKESSRLAYFVVQEGRKHFENIAFIQGLESEGEPSRVVSVGGACAAKIYHAQAFAQLKELR